MAVDGFVPVLPSETLVIGMGAVAIGGTPHVALLVAAAAIGSLTGDLVAYHLGDKAASRFRDSAPAASDGKNRLRQCLERGSRALRRYGALAVILGRYLPGGRTATAMAAGSIGYSRRRFWMSSAAGSAGWATYVAALGYLGGAVLSDQPGFAMLPGLLIGAATALTVYIVGRVRRARLSSTGTGHRTASHPDSRLS
ncbi:DedA family protein [Actinoplanes auranticolor]|uniref:DedA family protein n=1 Tax=Actinoplanes auranticolor TaxID=47988 RepID=UPI001BB3CD04|nr:DedA family protein [Actinoplanes auranticolor]